MYIECNTFPSLQQYPFDCMYFFACSRIERKQRNVDIAKKLNNYFQAYPDGSINHILPDNTINPLWSLWVADNNILENMSPTVKRSENHYFNI